MARLKRQRRKVLPSTALLASTFSVLVSSAASSVFVSACQPHTKELVLTTFYLAVNTAVLGAVGYFSYVNWDRPSWDRRTVSAVTVGLLTLWTGEGYGHSSMIIAWTHTHAHSIASLLSVTVPSSTKRLRDDCGNTGQFDTIYACTVLLLYSFMTARIVTPSYQ